MSDTEERDAEVSQAESTLYELERELYWAKDRAARASLDTAALRDRVHEMALTLRRDETLIVPHGEPNLASRSRGRRRLKRLIWRGMRPISWRYDRLLADQAELTIGLAEQLMAAEAEIARLRDQVAAIEGEGGAPRSAEDSTQ
jgi:hypothetical protein